MARVADLFDGSGRPVVLRVGSGQSGAVALAAAAASIALVPKTRVSTVAHLRGSSLLRVGGVTDETRDAVTAAITTSLAMQGLTDSIESLPADRLDAVDATADAVLLRLFPPRGARLGLGWAAEAMAWVAPSGDGDVTVRLLGHDVAASVGETATILDDAFATMSWIDVIEGDPAAVIRTASATFGTTPHLTLGAGGPACTDDDLVAWAERLIAVGRRLASTAGYACLSIEPTFADIGYGLPDDGWFHEGGADPNIVAARLSTTHIPDVFPYQLLTGTHADRLAPGSSAEAPPVGLPLGDDRFEVFIGTLRDWLPRARTRSHVRADAWIEFEPLLVLDDDLATLVNGPGHSVDVPASVTIAPIPQLSRGTAVSLLQLTAWLADSEHTDAPTCVPEATATFARLLSSALDNEPRAGLRPAAEALARGDGATDEAAATAAVRWIVANARVWIDAAALDEVQAPGPIDLDDHTAVVRATQQLSAAIVAATTRADVAAALVGPASDLLEQIIWDVWERVADRTGTTAAAATATHGVDRDITDATEDRVIALSRSGDARMATDRSGIGFSDEVWATATRELASRAWRTAWEVLDDHVGFHWSFSARAAIRRALETDPTIRGDRDAVDEAVESAEDVAVAALARLSLSGRIHPDPFGAALTAVRESPKNARWCAAMDDAREAVTSELFDEAMAEAVAWLAAEVQPATRGLQYAVLTAIAREAAGASTRVVAAQAAAPALGRGGNYALAGAAARAEVDPVADRQTASAIALLHSLAGTPESLRG